MLESMPGIHLSIVRVLFGLTISA